MKEKSFVDDIRFSARKHFDKNSKTESNLTPEAETTTPLAEQLKNIDFDKPKEALKIIDQVLDTIKSQLERNTLTTREVDLAMEQMAKLAKKAKNILKKEKAEAQTAEKKLTTTDKIVSFFRGTNDRISLARRERKEADQALKTENKTKQIGSQFDEAVDNLIISEVVAAEPEFSKIIKLQDILNNLIEAGKNVIEAASHLSTASALDATMNVKTGNDLIDAAVESGQNSQVLAAEAQLSSSLEDFMDLLKKHKGVIEGLSWSPNLLQKFNNMSDVTWHIIGNDSMISIGAMMDSIGGIMAMSEADRVKNETQKIVKQLKEEFLTTQTAITRVIETIREDLQLG